MKTLRDVLQRVRTESIEVGTEYLGLLTIAVGHFERANGSVDLRQLTSNHVREMMRAMLDVGRAAITINNNRRYILFLWRKARSLNFDVAVPPPEDERPRRLREPVRKPTAWWPAELAAIVEACGRMPWSRGWGPPHDEALTLGIYDTSLRISCLLASEVSQLDTRRCALFVPGELQKGKADTYQPIHPETCNKLQSLPRLSGDKRLYPWPFAKREIWRRLEALLKLAGLPHGRRDKWHRRTNHATARGLCAPSN